MLNNIDIKLVFTKSSNEFCLFGDKTLTKSNGIFEETFFRIERFKISNAAILAHAMSIEQTTAKYPIKGLLLKQSLFLIVQRFLLSQIFILV